MTDSSMHRDRALGTIITAQIRSFRLSLITEARRERKQVK
uniref:Uncharacterized protein n=1 Tax=Rhizophora mucronata TaxID=61149 RepID=A0A2P2R4B2_RHIMU